MTIAKWLVNTMTVLHKSEVDSPRRDALVLLEDTLNRDRAWVLSHPEHNLKGPELKKVNKLVKKRTNREPLAYIRGKAWFYGRIFNITPDVLIPRPESEAFINLMKLIKDSKNSSYFNVFDIGTGCGCLAITAKLEFPEASVIASDVEEKPLLIAKNNSKKHNTNIKFIAGDLINPPLKKELQKIADRPKNVTVLMANLPYVPTGIVSSPEIKYEPKNALFSGSDGLDHYRRLFEQIKELPHKPMYLLTESLEKQHDSLNELAKNSGYKLEKTEILVQLFKLR